jgi:hypothetical protein
MHHPSAHHVIEGVGIVWENEFRRAHKRILGFALFHCGKGTKAGVGSIGKIGPVQEFFGISNAVLKRSTNLFFFAP